MRKIYFVENNYILSIKYFFSKKSNKNYEIIKKTLLISLIFTRYVNADANDPVAYLAGYATNIDVNQAGGPGNIDLRDIKYGGYFYSSAMYVFKLNWTFAKRVFS